MGQRIPEAEKRKQILDRSRAIFMARGVSALSMDQIASLQGISKKTLYRFFPNKAALTEEAIESRIREVAANVEKIARNSDLSFLARMRGIFDIVSRQISELGENFVKDVYYHEPEIWERIDKFRREHVFEIITRLLKEGIRQGHIRDDIDGRSGAPSLYQHHKLRHDPRAARQGAVSAGRALRRLHPHSLRRCPDREGAPPVLHPGGHTMKQFLIAAYVCAVLAGCAKSTDTIEASGSIEATSVQVSSKSSGEILHLDASEGFQVKKGDLLALIDHSNLDIQLGQAKSGVDLARAQLDLLTNGARGEDLAQARETLNEANESLSSAQEDFQRLDSLFKAAAATKKQRDDAETRLITARAQAASAEQGLRKLENFARPEDVKAALARVDQAVYSVRLLEKEIQDCTVHSPTDGMVTEKLVEEGELAAPGTGLYVITDLDTVKLTIYVPETELGNIRLGEKARISIDSRRGAAFPGTVTYISPVAEFTPRDIQTKDERVKLVYAVRVEIPNAEGIFKPGMPADAVLDRIGGQKS